MSFSDSDPENETCAIMLAQNTNDSPPRKKRRLNNNQSQHSSPSSIESKSESDSSVSSDKENSTHNSRTRKRPRSSQSTHQIYKFGKQTYDIPLNVNPGAIIRIKLTNFLCHDNFEIAFHPNVNIIHGQNGAGKSAIEAGISMALGQNSKKTGRGKSIMDVIKDDKQWSKIQLFLYNQGPEKIPEFGDEIIIERYLSKTGKNGSSRFKVLDGDTLKSKGTGVKAVKAIADKFNLSVDNPCVVLKQSVAKEFLNSTKAKDKFNFFMQASKLGSYIQCLEEARMNVDEAREQQKQTKGSFVAIKNQYYEAKRNLDTLEQMESQKEKVKYWKRSEKWMVYHKQKDSVHKYAETVATNEKKISKAKGQLEGLKEKLKVNIVRAKEIQSEIESKTAESDRFKQPINVLKKKQKELENERKKMARNVNSHQGQIDKSNRKIRDFKRQEKDCINSMENNERAQQLEAIAKKLEKCTNDLNKYRNERDILKDKCEESIELKDNNQKLNHKKTQVYNIENEQKKLSEKLNRLNQQSSRIELFLDPKLKYYSNNNRNNNRSNRNRNSNEISVTAIRKVIQKYKRQFSRPPIGPLGEYIQLKDFGDREQNRRNLQIVQNVLSKSMYVFLVDNGRDQQLFGKIMKQTFGKIVPCISYKFSNKMEVINSNPFNNYQTNENNGPLIRVTDMFNIKDNHSWVYNAIITNSQPERVYAHGDLQTAKSFLNKLDANKLRVVKCVMTYRERDGFYKVSKKGKTISGTPQQQMDPILQADTAAHKQWYQQQLNKKVQEKNDIDAEINQLQRFINESNKILKDNKNKLYGFNRNIKSLEHGIEKLQRDETEIREEEEGDEGLKNVLEELRNSIEDEKLAIDEIQKEIEPFKEKDEKLMIELANTKKQLNDMKQKVENEMHSIEGQQRHFQEILQTIKKQQVSVTKVPTRITQMENELAENRNEFEEEKERINGLLNNAKELGDEVTAENYPRNDANRKRLFSLRDLKRARETLESEIEAWENTLGENDADNIRRRFENIRPKYEQHQQRVDNCNLHCDEMAKQLHHRQKNYNQMKISVKDRLSLEFKYIMKQQGHDGRLEIDYENGTLDMECHMSSHDGQSQVRNTKTLSGGERSYAQVALIMALQKFSGSPMCIYDEFDVFMDSVNRGNSIKILLNAALGQDRRRNNNNNNNNNNNSGGSCVGERQYIFITPNDVSPIIAQGHKNQVKIFQLKAPRRS